MKRILKMIVFIKTLIPQMILAIVIGVCGFLMAFGLGVLGAYGIVGLIPAFQEQLVGIPFGNISFDTVVKALIVCALFRGILHYVEQFCNHYIAFKILAKFRL